MKLLGYLLLVSMSLAALKAAVTAIAAAAGLAGIICLIQRPRETLVALFTIGATFAFVAHPLVVVGALASVAGVSQLMLREKS